MKIINMTPNESGAYPPIQTGTFSRCPEGCAVVPDDMDTSAYYECGGFVDITATDGIVTAMTGRPDAWAAWKAEHPEPKPEPEPTPDDTTVTWDALAAAYAEGVNSIDQ